MTYRRFAIVLMLWVFAVAISAQDYDIITPDNIHQLENVSDSGYGYVTDARFIDNNKFVIGNYYGGAEWVFNVNNMTEIAEFRPAYTYHDYDPNIVYGYGYNPVTTDKKWFISSQGVYSTETDELVLSYIGQGQVKSYIRIADYLVIWRERFNLDTEVQCTYENTDCKQHITIFDTRTQTLYDELYLEGVKHIQSALNRTHLAVATETETFFYNFPRYHSLELAFTMPVALFNINESGMFASEVDRDNNTVRLWNIDTQSVQLNINYLEGEFISYTKISPNGRYFAVATTASLVDSNEIFVQDLIKNVVIWDILTGERVSSFQYFAPSMWIEFSDNGRYFAVWSQSNVFFAIEKDFVFVTLFETATARQIAQIDNGYRRPVSDMQFNPDSRLLVLTFYDGRMIIIETETGRIVWDIAGYGGYAEYIHFKDDEIYVTKSDDYTDIYDASSLQHQQRIDCSIIAIHPTAPIVVCNEDNFTNGEFAYDYVPPVILNLETGETIPFQHEFGPGEWLQTAFFTADEDELITMSAWSDADPIVWDTETYELKHIFEDAHQGYPVCEFLYLKNNKYLASDSQLVIWDADTYEIIVSLPYTGVTYSEVGDWVAAETGEYIGDSYEGGISIWRLSELIENPDAEPFHVMQDNQFGYSSLTASPDGRLLLVTNDKQTFALETKTFTIIHQYPSGGGNIKFSPDGRYIFYFKSNCGNMGADESLHIGRAQVWAVPK